MKRGHTLLTYTEPVPSKCGKLATKYPWTCTEIFTVYKLKLTDQEVKIWQTDATAYTETDPLNKWHHRDQGRSLTSTIVLFSRATDLPLSNDMPQQTANCRTVAIQRVTTAYSWILHDNSTIYTVSNSVIWEVVSDLSNTVTYQIRSFQISGFPLALKSPEIGQ